MRRRSDATHRFELQLIEQRWRIEFEFAECIEFEQHIVIKLVVGVLIVGLVVGLIVGFILGFVVRLELGRFLVIDVAAVVTHRRVFDVAPRSDERVRHARIKVPGTDRATPYASERSDDGPTPDHEPPPGLAPRRYSRLPRVDVTTFRPQ